MGRNRYERPPLEAIVLVCELGQRCDKQGWHWDVIVSRANRDGTFIQTWDNASGRLSSEQAEDLTGWVQTTFYNALLAWGGIQTVLDV